MLQMQAVVSWDSWSSHLKPFWLGALACPVFPAASPGLPSAHSRCAGTSVLSLERLALKSESEKFGAQRWGLWRLLHYLGDLCLQAELALCPEIHSEDTISHATL